MHMHRTVHGRTVILWICDGRYHTFVRNISVEGSWLGICFFVKPLNHVVGHPNAYVSYFQLCPFAEHVNAHTAEIDTHIFKTENNIAHFLKISVDIFLTTLGYFGRGTLKATQKHFFDILKDFGKMGLTAGGNIAGLIQPR